MKCADKLTDIISPINVHVVQRMQNAWKQIVLPDLLGIILFNKHCREANRKWFAYSEDLQESNHLYAVLEDEKSYLHRNIVMTHYIINNISYHITKYFHNAYKGTVYTYSMWETEVQSPFATEKEIHLPFPTKLANCTHFTKACVLHQFSCC